jgi:hypothetical protein
MRNSIFDWILLFVMLTLLGGVFFIMGFLYLPLIALGPEVIFKVMVVTTATVIALNWWLGFMLLDMTVDHPRFWGLMFGLIVGAGNAFVPATMLWDGHAERAHLEAQAPLARDFAIRHFDELDRDHTGIITDGNLGAAEEDPRFTENEHALAHVLKTQIDLAGHVISSHQTWVPITTIISCGNGCTMPITNNVEMTVYVYGISRDDLSGFPDRVHQKWQKW